MEQKNNSVHGVAYGKLYIAGEYSILEDYSKAILYGVDKKITAVVTPSNGKTTITDTLFNERVSLESKDNRFELIQNFIHFLFKFIKNRQHFSLEIINELHSENKKYGLGSSGAVLVAIARAILKFHKINYNDLLIFKIVTLYNLSHNVKGSMGDVAAALNKGFTFYQKFSTKEIIELLKNKIDFWAIINSKWEGLIIKNIETKAPITFIAHWTGEVIDTKEHIHLWQENKKYKIDEYKKFVSISNQLVTTLENCLLNNNSEQFFTTINQLRNNLLELEKISGIPMETPLMKKYISLFPAGKQSGSGSGDFVLAFKENDQYFNMNLILKPLNDI